MRGNSIRTVRSCHTTLPYCSSSLAFFFPSAVTIILRPPFHLFLIHNLFCLQRLVWAPETCLESIVWLIQGTNTIKNWFAAHYWPMWIINQGLTAMPASVCFLCSLNCVYLGFWCFFSDIVETICFFIASRGLTGRCKSLMSKEFCWCVFNFLLMISVGFSLTFYQVLRILSRQAGVVSRVQFYQSVNVKY